MAQPSECRLKLTLALDPAHWRRHDRAFWIQVLTNAVDTAAPHVLKVEGYDVQEALIYIRARAAKAPKTMKKLLREDESFRRLRARLADLGARSDFEIEGADHGPG